jgi:hypothetical protein
MCHDFQRVLERSARRACAESHCGRQRVADPGAASGKYLPVGSAGGVQHRGAPPFREAGTVVA